MSKAPHLFVLPFAALSIGLVGCVDVQPDPWRDPWPADPEAHPGALVPSNGNTPSPTPTLTPTATEPETPTPTPSIPETETPTVTPSRTFTPTPTVTVSPTPPPTVDPIDPDGDGFSEGEGDCAPFDGSIYPGAPETPFDGVDSDCDGKQDLISTFAGPLLNEGGDFETARLYGPLDLALSEDGTLYFTDASHCLVRQVNDGIVTTLAGSGACGYDGDGGLAIAAELDFPTGLALDEDGRRLFVSDLFNNRIRVIDLETGLIDTHAGTGLEGTPIDGEFASLVNMTYPYGLEWVSNSKTLYVAQIGRNTTSDENGRMVWRIVEDGLPAPTILHVAGSGALGTPVDGPAKETPVSGPVNIVVDPLETKAYVTVAYGDGFVIEIDDPRSDSPTLKTIVGGGSEELDCRAPIPADPFALNICEPEGLALSDDGGLFVSLRRNYAVVRYDFESEALAKVAGSQGERSSEDREDGAALGVNLYIPYALLSDGVDGFYVSETLNFIIRHYTPGETLEDGTLTNIGGYPRFGYQDGPLHEANFYFPAGMDVYTDPVTGEDTLYVADTGYDLIRRIEGGFVSTVAGVPLEELPLGDGGLAEEADLEDLQDVTVDGFGIIYILMDDKIRRIRDGYIETVTGAGEREDWLEAMAAGEARLDAPNSIAVSDDGSALYIAEGNLIRVVRNPAGREAVIEPYIGNGESGSVIDGAGLLETPLDPKGLFWSNGELLFGNVSPTQVVVTENGVLRVIAMTQSSGGILSAATRLDGLARAEDGSIFLAFERDGVFRLKNGIEQRVMGDGDHTSYNRDSGVGTEVYYDGRMGNSLTMSSDGSLYISDGFNQVIRIIDW